MLSPARIVFRCIAVLLGIAFVGGGILMVSTDPPWSLRRALSDITPVVMGVFFVLYGLMGESRPAENPSRLHTSLWLIFGISMLAVGLYLLLTKDLLGVYFSAYGVIVIWMFLVWRKWSRAA